MRNSIKTKLLQTAIVAVALLLPLSGCMTVKEDRNLDYVGTYELLRIEGGSIDAGISEEEVKELKAFNLNCYLYMNEDGTAVLDNYGTEEHFTWNNNNLVYVDSEETVPYEINGTTLTIKDDNTSQTLVFTKTEQ